MRPTPPDEAEIQRIASLCHEATSVLFITGAGLSAESGLPTYRGVGGLYDDATTEEGMPIEEALSGQMLEQDPALCWKYIARLEKACRGARPNRAHDIIASFEKRIPRTWVLTQNVDGFHHRAGSSKIIEIHGNVGKLRCTLCTYKTRVETYAGLPLPPTCPRCHGVVRPEVVLFGEMLPDAEIEALRREIAHGFDLVFSIGTTSVFAYIRAPVVMARRSGGTAIEINPGPTEVSELVHHKLAAGAVDALGRIWEAWTKIAKR